MENDNSLAFLDILIKIFSNGPVGHRIYRKPTHTYRYLDAGLYFGQSAKYWLQF